jgi:signal transduction histidine kinase
MVENLPYLSRMEAGQLDVRRMSVGLTGLARTVWEPLAESAAERRLDVRWELPAQAPVSIDPTLAGLAVRNFLDNAVSHANENGTIEITIVHEGHQTVLSVNNSGSSVSQDEASSHSEGNQTTWVGRMDTDSMLFERLSRGNDSKSATGLHCGLGLPLVRNVAMLLGHSIMSPPQ